MRFKAEIRSVKTFAQLTASLASIGKVAWVRLDDRDVRFTIIPEQGSQVWAVLQPETVFESYKIQSAAENNTINLEVPVQPLTNALRSAQGAHSANIRLTKKDDIPLLSITITSTALGGTTIGTYGFRSGTERTGYGFDGEPSLAEAFTGRGHETTITQDVPVRVLSVRNFEGIHEPRCREPDVHILLPPLMQLKSISDRFTRLALAGKPVSGTGLTTTGPKLEMSANMHGCLRLGVKTDTMKISSTWTGLDNPELDPTIIEGGEEGLARHPSTRMKELADREGVGEEAWAKVRIDGKDWGKVLSVGRLGGRVVACGSSALYKRC